jgi:hypothetical protein
VQIIDQDGYPDYNSTQTTWTASDGTSGTGADTMPDLDSLPWVTGLADGYDGKFPNTDYGLVAPPENATGGLWPGGMPDPEAFIIDGGWIGRSVDREAMTTSEVRMRRKTVEEGGSGNNGAITRTLMDETEETDETGTKTIVIAQMEDIILSEALDDTPPKKSQPDAPAGKAMVEKKSPPEFILDNNNIAYKPNSEALGVSNYVTTEGLPQDSQFGDLNADPENFRLQAKLPNTTATTVQMKLEVNRAVLTEGQTSLVLVATYNYTLDKKQGDFFRGKFLRLVTDTNDDAESGDQTILVKLGDTIKASYDIAGSKLEQEIQVGRPSSEDNNESANPRKHDIREVNVRIVTVKDEAGNACVSDARVNELVDNANERLAQAGIRLKRTQATIEIIAPPSKPKDDFGEAYTYDQQYQDSPFQDPPSADEVAFSRAKDGDSNTIDIFFIKQFKDTVDTAAMAYFPARNMSGKPAFNNFIVISTAAARPFSLPHEIMHVLLNQGHRDLEPNTALFYSPTAINKAVYGKKRIGPYPQSTSPNVGNDDTTTMRSNAEKLP